MKKHLSLAFHCLKKNHSIQTPYNPELFITVSELESLIKELLSRGYSFDLIRNLKEDVHPTCSISFDDGYYNNYLFQPLAEKYNIPFIVFISAYNIRNGSFYLWDLMSSNNHSTWNWKGQSYIDLYKDQNDIMLKDPNLNDLYRPMTPDELRSFSDHSKTFLGNHTFSHTPLIKNQLDRALDIEACSSFLADYPNVLRDELALPCGLLSGRGKEFASQGIKRIYTINGGLNLVSDPIINRISLEGPSVRGPLIGQIERATNPIHLLKRKIFTFVHSNF